MSETRAAQLRRLWLNLHLWIGAGLGLLIVPIAISGCLLVFHDELDAWFNPARYAVTGVNTGLPPSAYLDSAARAAGPGLTPAVVRYPESDDAPLVVSARSARGEGPPRLINVYLDPATGRVLDTVDFRSSFFGFLHRFHENLTIPEYYGRSVVGWVGVAMLISSLTGIWLWWPRSGALWLGLRWQRSPATITNLHHLVGFWIALPLAAVSFTGIYLGFPQQGRQVLSSLATMTPQGQRPFSGAPVHKTTHTPDQALALALAGTPGSRPAALFLPTASRQSQEPPLWRVQLRLPDSSQPVTVLVDDASGRVRATTAGTLPGDRAAQWIRWIHEGSHSGPVWRGIVFLCGLAPPVFVLTGVIMWWRKRTSRKALETLREAGQLRPAE